MKPQLFFVSLYQLIIIHHTSFLSKVLSELLADLDACDVQKGETKVLANGEVAPGKSNYVANVGGKTSVHKIRCCYSSYTCYCHLQTRRQL